MSPIEAIPDKAIFAPHHFYIGFFIIYTGVKRVWDNYPRKEPMFAFIGAIVSLFGFSLTWKYYPFVGVILCFVGLLLVIIGILRTWFNESHKYPKSYYILLSIGILIMVDDLVSHGFGIATPLDTWVWEGLIFPFIR